jgi:chromosome segregation ATPase
MMDEDCVHRRQQEIAELRSELQATESRIAIEHEACQSAMRQQQEANVHILALEESLEAIRMQLKEALSIQVCNSPHWIFVCDCLSSCAY